MPKSKIKNAYLERLAFVNDQLCYFQFADDEVRRIIEGLGDVDPLKMTPEIFSENPYSTRIRVRFDELLSFREKAMATSSGISISLGVEHLLYYLDDIRELKLEISKATESPEKSDTPESRAEKNLKHWGASISPAVFKTIKYFRLRRNHIVHARSTLTSEFDRFIRHESHHLNSYWTSRTSLTGLDFSSKDIESFSVSEVYTCAKLLRVCIEEIDEAIASTFSNENLIEYMAREILDRDKKLKGSIKVLSRKVCRCIKDHFGVDIEHVKVESFVKGLLENA
ncbi:hypothetical protein GCM10008027_12040 [Pseudoalteromonas gelatinilytica]|uniref:Apea-like HEPN domain-containing protein n=1 Tax=Pseudoalteromonas gelatinilytica TaxID=1703256 RepID=A0ABQ1TAS3_9GAMM|nr:hypothetical protein GCM10008027_12040 [Pseudoalteromonas profundi]